MEIVYKKLDEIRPYANNPRFNDEAVEYVANSIKEFGFKVPIIIDKNGEIVAGHTRYKASMELGLEEVPCIVADDLTEEQVKAFRLADNKVSEKALWNYDLLEIELADIGIDMSGFGFLEDLEEEATNELDFEYTNKIKIPQYEITGFEPKIQDLVDDYKVNQLIEEIEASNVSREQKDFLIKAAQRHLTFNYGDIAEYYAHQDKEMQELMEKSALVIIDIKDAIANGFVELTDKLEEIMNDEEK